MHGVKKALKLKQSKRKVREKGREGEVGTQGRGLSYQERSGNRCNEEKEALESNLQELERHCQESNKDKVVHQRECEERKSSHGMTGSDILRGETEEMGVER